MFVHTVAVRLLTRPHDERGADQRLLALGQLRNAVVREARRRAGALRTDSRWREHALITNSRERRRAYAALRHEHGVGEFHTRELACAHWSASGWMGDLLDRRAANALGREVWASMEAWLYRGGGRPRTEHPGERDTAWGNDLNGGLCVRPDPRKSVDAQPALADVRVVWGTEAIRRSGARLGRKRLELPLDWLCLSAPRREFVHENIHLLRTVGIRRRVVRGRPSYWALLVLDRDPYRSESYRDRVAQRPADSVLGLDMGPTEQAWVTEAASGSIRLGDTALARAKESAARERRLQRALVRSRRASNPDCYDEQGRTLRGQRPRKLSRRGRRLASDHTEAKRKSAAQRKRATIHAAQEAALLAPIVRVEDQSFKSWQAGGYGKRMLLTTPGLFLSRLDAEQKLTGGAVQRLPLNSAFSQYCVCATKTKKPRGQNWHQCETPGCPIRGVGLDRHLFSAWLMRATASLQNGIAGMHEGALATLLTEVPGNQESLVALCASRGRAKHPEAGTRTRKRNRSKGVAGRKAQEIKPTRALPPQDHAGTRGEVAGTDAHGNAALLEKPTRPPSPR